VDVFWGHGVDFAVTQFLMKLFGSASINVIDERRMFFNFMLPSEKRRISFESKVLNCNSLLYYFNICPKYCQYSAFIVYLVKLVKISSFSLLPVLIDTGEKRSSLTV